LERLKHIKDRKLASSTNSEQARPTLLEKLEPRILLSGDSLLYAAAPDALQETLLDSPQYVIQYAELLDTDQQVEQQLPNAEHEIHQQLDPSDLADTDLDQVIFTLSADDDINDKVIDKTAGDLNAGNIGTAQTSDDLAVLSDDSGGNVHNKTAATEIADSTIEEPVGNDYAVPTDDGSMPICIADTDPSIEYATSVDIRGPPASEPAHIENIPVRQANEDALVFKALADQNDLTLRIGSANSEDVELLDNRTGEVLIRCPAVDVYAVKIIGSDEADDTLRINLGPDSCLGYDIHFCGGDGGYDSLVMNGLPGHNTAYEAIGADSGIITCSDGTETTTISFSGLEPYTVDGGASLTFDPGSDNGGTDIITVGVDPLYANANQIMGTNGGVEFEVVTFLNIPDVTIDTGANDTFGDAADSVTIESDGLVATGLASFAIATGDGDDTIQVVASDTVPISVQGGTGHDELIVDPLGAAVSFGDGSVLVSGMQPVSYDGETEVLTVVGLGSFWTQGIIADGPVAYYRLGEDSGTIAKDFSGYGLDGTYVNGVTLGAEGALAGDSDTAASFDGDNDSVVVADAAELDLNEQFTLEAWVFPRLITGADRAVISKVGGSGGNNGYQMGISHGSQVFLSFNAPGEGWPTNSVATAVLPLLDTWTHIAGTYDNDTLQIYVNGQLAASKTIGAKNVVNSSSSLRISGDDNLHVYFDGVIDEVAIYDRALSAERVRAHYYARYAAVPDPPVILGVQPLPADGGSVTAAIDRLIVETSKDLLPGSANDSASWELRGAGPDETLGTTDDVLYALSTNPEYQTGTMITLEIADAPIPLGWHRFTAFASAVADFMGTPLDGDGDRLSGDDFVRTFEVTATEYEQTILSDNAVAYYRLGETSGTTARDSSGNGLHGTYVNGVTLGALGPLVGDSNTAASFDGVDDYIILPNSASLLPTTALTLEAWINPKDLITDQHIISTAGPGPSPYGHDYYMRLVDRGLEFRINDVPFFVSNAITVDNQWYHVVATYDQVESLRKIYVNNNLLGINSYNSPVNTGHNYVTIGLNARTLAFGTNFIPFKGLIDEVVVFNTALSAERIASHYYARYAADPSPPVIVEVDPLPAEGESVTAAIDHLTVEVGKDLLASAANDPASWELRGAGPDETFDTADDVLHVLSTNPEYTTGTTIGLDIADSHLTPGWYCFTAFASVVVDYAGNALDGNGDGIGGDDFIRTFQVANAPGVIIEVEGNNVLSEAMALSFAEDPIGSGYFMGRGLGSIVPATYDNTWSDPDYWSFEAFAGDVISISVDTPDSDLDPYVELRNSADGVLASDNNNGPGNDAFISHYTISSSGAYYVRVGATVRRLAFMNCVWIWPGEASSRVMPTTLMT